MSRIRHPDFFHDNHKVFLVENTLFRVAIGKLVDESEFFKNLFAEGSPVIDTMRGEEGESVDHPITIGDESPDDFALLMRWVYMKHTIKDFKAKEWIACLRIAHKFGVHLLSEAAQDALQGEAFDPVEKVQLCFNYDLDLAWAKDAVSNICYNWNPLPLLPQTDALPLEFRHECMLIREGIIKSRAIPGSAYGYHWCDGCNTWRHPSYRRSEETRGPLRRKEKCSIDGCKNPTALYIVPPDSRDKAVTESVLSLFPREV